MAARKGWSNLSPNYRKRLERHGINRRIYESGSTLKRARGHGPSTPSSRRHTAEVASRRGETKGLIKLIDEGQQLNIEPNTTRILYDLYGQNFTHLLYRFKEFRNNDWIKHGSQDTKTRAKTGYVGYDIRNLEQWATKHGFKWKSDYDLYLLSLDYDSIYVYYH